MSDIEISVQDGVGIIDIPDGIFEFDGYEIDWMQGDEPTTVYLSRKGVHIGTVCGSGVANQIDEAEIGAGGEKSPYPRLSARVEGALLGLLAPKEREIFVVDREGVLSDAEVAEVAETTEKMASKTRSKIRSEYIPEAREIARFVEAD